MTYQLGVDLGTTYTAAAIHRDGVARTIDLGTRTAAAPSLIYMAEDASTLFGEAAERRSIGESHRVAREFKRRLGDETPLLLGRTAVPAEHLMALLFRWVVDHVVGLENEIPADVVVTHPANWGSYRMGLLHEAIGLSRVQHVRTLPEPVAAAIHYATRAQTPIGNVLGVFDLGGGTLDVAVLLKTVVGFEILGEPVGIDRLGGIDFDEEMYERVIAELGTRWTTLDPRAEETVRAASRLRIECVAAKEGLSFDTTVNVPAALPIGYIDVTVGRAEFEERIRPLLSPGIEAMQRAIARANLSPSHLDGILLVGGSSRMPVVAEMLTSQIDLPVLTDTHPKHAVALGAALAASGATTASNASWGDTGPALVPDPESVPEAGPVDDAWFTETVMIPRPTPPPAP